jgi:hypothetical protein
MYVLIAMRKDSVNSARSISKLKKALARLPAMTGTATSVTLKR